MRTILLVTLIVLPLAAALANHPQQPPPVSTEQPVPPTIQSGPPIAPGQQTTPVVPGAATPIVIPAETAVPTATALPAPDDASIILVRARSDLELLATAQLGGSRPTGWSGSSDINNPQLAILTRLDLEILAGAIYSASERPAGWFGAVASSPYAIARDIRHDLELLADATTGSQRPIGWIGDNPLMRCNRGTQALVRLLEAGGVFQLQLDPTAPDFCAQAEIVASQFAEVNLLANPNLAGGANPASGPAVVSASISSEFAVAFLDRSAVQRAGVIPNGTAITPVGRSYAQFSNMMLVRGDNFEVYVDFQFTTVTRDEFDALPNVDGLTVNPFCQAEWCSGG